MGRDVSHAKAQSRKGKCSETRQRFASLRLCVRNLLRNHTFCAKPAKWQRIIQTVIDRAEQVKQKDLVYPRVLRSLTFSYLIFPGP
jgi:hypothetical protein